jgi:hypothetical protein
MGFQNVTRARFVGRKLRSVNAFKVLMEMAQTALDDGDPPQYWGSWESLALVMGFDVPAKPDDGDPDGTRALALRRTARNAVVQAKTHLVDEGLITPDRPPSPGQSRRWNLLLEPFNVHERARSSRARGHRDEKGRWVRDVPGVSGHERARKLRYDVPVKSGTTCPEFPGTEEQRGTTNDQIDDPTSRLPQLQEGHNRDPIPATAHEHDASDASDVSARPHPRRNTA